MPAGRPAGDPLPANAERFPGHTPVQMEYLLLWYFTNSIGEGKLVQVNPLR